MSLPKEGYIPFDISKSTYQILCELKEGDTIQWRPPHHVKDTLDATIIDFHYDHLGYRIKAHSPGYERPILIQLNWVQIDESIIRDIKLNRILI